MKILLTAFDPFGGETINAAEEAARLVPQEICGAQIVKLTVPTVFYKCVSALEQELNREQFDAVLCLGQAGGRRGLTPERVAINLMDARIPDNEGFAPVDQAIFPDGKNAYFSTLPIKAMTRRIREAGLWAEVSNTAGTFVCNHLMYGLLYTLEKKFPAVRGGFLHVPFTPKQAAERDPALFSMELSDIAKGIEAALGAVAEFRNDLSMSEGKTC